MFTTAASRACSDKFNHDGLQAGYFSDERRERAVAGTGGAILGRSLQSGGRSIGTQRVLDTGQHENGPKGGLCDGPQSLHANLAGTSRLSKPVPRLHPSASFEPCAPQREGGV